MITSYLSQVLVVADNTHTIKLVFSLFKYLCYCSVLSLFTLQVMPDLREVSGRNPLKIAGMDERPSFMCRRWVC